MQIDKEKLLDRINDIADMFYNQGDIKTAGLFVILRDEIESGTFDVRSDDSEVHSMQCNVCGKTIDICKCEVEASHETL